MTLRHLILAIALLPVLVSCDKPDCNNTNPVFEQYGKDEEMYQRELRRTLAGKDLSEMGFWFGAVLERDGKIYILVDMIGEGICAQGMLLVEDWKGLEGIRKAGGKGYRGAELSGLRFEVREDELVYRSVDRIVD